LLLGIDVGSSSTKGVLATARGDIVAQHQVAHTLSIPRPGWAEHDPESDWWGDFLTVCRALVTPQRSAAVKGVAVSGIGPCFCPADAAGNALRPGILYGIDTRATAEIDDLTDRLGEDAILQRSGSALTAQAVGPKLLWFRRHEPELYARTRYLLPASSLLVQRLTGEYVIDCHTASGFNPLYDVHQGRWIDEWVPAVLGADAPPLPRVLWATEIAGQLHAAAAEQTGLPVGTPVTAGTIDAAAEALSIGVRRPGDLMVMYGTTMFLILVVDRPRPDRRMWGTRFVVPPTANIAAGLSTSGAVTAWFRSILECGPDTPSYAQLVDEAAAVAPGADGLVVLPYFSGERTPIQDPLARGLFAGLTLHHTRGHLYRALLEGTAFGFRHNLDTFRDIGAPITRAVAVGGGATSDLWPQIVADVSGLDQEIPSVTVGAGLGDCLLAGIATGLATADDVEAWNPIRKVLRADPSRATTYDHLYEIYRSLYPATADQMHALSEWSNSARS
jgi:xylulokinase